MPVLAATARAKRSRSSVRSMEVAFTMAKRGHARRVWQPMVRCLVHSQPRRSRAWHLGPLATLCTTTVALLLALAFPRASVRAQEKNPRCPSEMVLVRSFCIDRWEMSTVDKQSGKPLSPYYPPSQRELGGVFDYWMLERRSFGDV